jgi:type I restriction enzyme S subunit
MTWHACRLGDVLTLKRGHDLPDSQRQPGDVPVVSSSGITGRHSESKAKAPGVVTGRYGTIGEVFYIEEDYWPLNTSLYVTDFKGNHPRFAAYLLECVLRNYQSDKAAVPGVNRNVLHELEVRRPDRTVQDRVADVLSNYDNLIENNRRRMALLEEAARHLYREWFIHLRFPGHEHTPLSDGLPEGWERRPLGQCATFFSGGTPSKARSDYWEGEIPWISSGELTDMRIQDSSLHVTPEAVEAGSRLVPPDTILVVVRGMSLAKEFRMAIVSRPVAFNQDLKALVSKSDVDAFYLFHSLETQREQIRDRASEASHGTKKLDTPVLSSVPITVPPRRFQEHFREVVEPLHSQWDNLFTQNIKLRAGRDLLLPRLMNGSLAV